MVACGSEVLLVWGDTEAIYLGVWMLNGSRANARESFPESMKCEHSIELNAIET